MNFTISTVAQSLASYLSPSFPGVTFIQNPTQQNADPPCMFLQQRYSSIKVKTSGRFLREIGLDLVYRERYNLPNLQELYQTAAEQLDLLMETFPYSDGTTAGTSLLRTYEREWNIDLDAMHYKFELHVRVEVPKTITPMETMNYSEDVTNGS